MNKKLIIIHTIVFVILEFFLFNLFYKQHKTLEDSYYSNKISHFEESYNLILNSYEKLSYTLFHSIINKEEILKVFNNGNSTDSLVKVKSREELQKLLSDFYKKSLDLGFRQLHFQLKDGESFLRFHKPNKFGDNIFPIRKTVLYANKNRTFVKGFEEGRIFNGFRYVYPIFYKKQHIGSVELSIPFETIKKELQKILPNEYSLLLKKRNISEKLFKEEIDKHYQVSTISDEFYLEKSEFNINPSLVKQLNNKLKIEAKEKLQNDRAFVISSKIDEESYLTVFYPIREFGGKVEGYIVSYSNRNISNIFTSEQKINLILGSLFIFFIVLTSYWLIRNKKLAEKRSYENSSKKAEIQKIFDAQKNMIVMVNKCKVINANKAFFEYVGFKNLKDFEKNGMKICQYFDKDNYNDSVDTICADDDQWLEKIISSDFQDFKVQIKGRVFAVNANKLDNNENYIATFTDITDTIQYQKKLEYEVALAVEKIEKQHQEILVNAKKAAMGDMIGIIAHQLKQPLSVVSLFTEDIEMDYEDGKLTPAGMKEFTETIKDRVKFMSDSIDNYRHFFNPNKEKEIFDVKEAVEKALDIIEAPISSRGIDIYRDLESIYIDGFEHDLIQVVMNIVINSKDALVENCSQDPFIDIKLFSVGDKMKLVISDNGGGIEEKNLEKVFNSYFSTKGEQGTGIGLNLAKMVIEESFEGSITVENSNQGACFTIETHLE